MNLSAVYVVTVNGKGLRVVPMQFYFKKEKSCAKVAEFCILIMIQ